MALFLKIRRQIEIDIYHTRFLRWCGSRVGGLLLRPCGGEGGLGARAVFGVRVEARVDPVCFTGGMACTKERINSRKENWIRWLVKREGDAALQS